MTLSEAQPAPQLPIDTRARVAIDLGRKLPLSHAFRRTAYRHRSRFAREASFKQRKIVGQIDIGFSAS